jgi:putative peptide zinc metalloprotease protein
MADNVASIVDRQTLIRAQPAFALLSNNESHELAEKMIELQYFPDGVIVTEGELVDRVFIIVRGQAEVLQNIVVKKKLQKGKIIQTPIAMLGEGDSIGLNDTGFFSSTGYRTATVVAVTEVIVLMIDLKILHEYLSRHPSQQNDMLNASAQMLRMRLIKQSLPFARLSHDRIRWLASQVEEVSVKAGTVIFSQGEMGDSCYLIRSGEVAIVASDEIEKERLLAVLKSPTLFGEATLITRDPRNATARAVTDVDLLMLKHVHLSELIESEKNVSSMFMTLMVDRSRPAVNPHVSVHPRTTEDGQEIVILKNHDNGNYFKLSLEGYFIWEQLNGKQTMHAVTMALADKFNTFAPDRVAALISKLGMAGFVENVEIDNPVLYQAKTFTGRMIANLRGMLEFRYAFGDADKWLSKVYAKGIYRIFSPLGKTIFSCIAILGFIAFLSTTIETIDTFSVMPNVWWLFAALIPATLVSVALHELGHAFAVKSYGNEVHYMGVGWFWVSPVAFTDTSDMWLSTRGPRIFVNMAGVLMDTLVAGFCSLVILMISNPYLQAFLWLFALYTYINAFRMMSPLQELDGYYVLMDLVDKPHLRESAVRWLIKDFPKALRKPELFKNHRAEVWYWLACLGFLFCITILTLLLQIFLFKIIGIHSNIWVSLSLPFLVAIFSVLGLVGDVRHQAD